MNQNLFVQNIDNNYCPDNQGNAYMSIFKEYERVIIESLITSFGLDFLIGDKHGGDVDTVVNVRKIGIDPNMKYKKKANQEAYDKKDKYDPISYGFCTPILEVIAFGNV